MTLNELIDALVAVRDETSGDVSVRVGSEGRSHPVAEATVIIAEQNAFEPYVLISADPAH
ncbi:hypothetical protein [Mesorhizobium sp.]|uniref:hypothetical protein n=1 Tax=Mesorhizobium sp. TaxID=1871066 RepID=UPI000FEA4715|nr:hypothetical protein [Mesorhizobium sp.]RWP30584.1 MAG: hypothetical protein EOR02_12615 [Mesorhizobium sp.]RWQ53683.1 MAG: hypothetical protein EOS82_08880 [Mesorhizobium sp.]